MTRLIVEKYSLVPGQGLVAFDPKSLFGRPAPAPVPTPPPVMPDPNDPAAMEARRKTTATASNGAGRRSTMLTTPLAGAGAPSAGSPLAAGGAYGSTKLGAG